MGIDPFLQAPSHGTEAGLLGRLLLDYCWQQDNDEICLNEIKRLVEKGADINFHDGFGLTPLAGLIHHNHMAGVQYLLNKGVKLNPPDDHCAQSFEKDACDRPKILKMILDEKIRRDHAEKRKTIFNAIQPTQKTLKRKQAHFKK